MPSTLVFKCATWASWTTTTSPSCLLSGQSNCQGRIFQFYVIYLPTSLISSSVKANTYLLGISQVSSLDSGEAVRWVSKALLMDLGTNLLDMVGFE